MYRFLITLWNTRFCTDDRLYVDEVIDGRKKHQQITGIHDFINGLTLGKMMRFDLSKQNYELRYLFGRRNKCLKQSEPRRFTTSDTIILTVSMSPTFIYIHSQPICGVRPAILRIASMGLVWRSHSEFSTVNDLVDGKEGLAMML